MAFDTRLLTGVGVLAAVTDTGNFARAAEMLGLTPSAVSRAVARLEARVGVLEHSDADGARWRAETDRRLEWVVCDGMVRQGIPYHGRRTQQECAADFILTGSQS